MLWPNVSENVPPVQALLPLAFVYDPERPLMVEVTAPPKVKVADVALMETPVTVVPEWATVIVRPVKVRTPPRLQSPGVKVVVDPVKLLMIPMIVV